MAKSIPSTAPAPPSAPPMPPTQTTAESVVAKSVIQPSDIDAALNDMRVLASFTDEYIKQFAKTEQDMVVQSMRFVAQNAERRLNVFFKSIQTQKG